METKEVLDSVDEIIDKLQPVLKSLTKLASRFEEINSSSQKQVEQFTALIKDDESGKQRKALDAFRIVCNEQIKMLQKFDSALQLMPENLKGMKRLVKLITETLSKIENVS
jgi:CHASE3 domain sensor protein